jgi:hypothetical protein
VSCECTEREERKRGSQSTTFQNTPHCKRLQTIANDCKRLQTIANHCKPLQTIANHCKPKTRYPFPHYSFPHHHHHHLPKSNMLANRMTKGRAPSRHPGRMNCRINSGLSQNILLISVPFTLNFHCFFIFGMCALNTMCLPLDNFKLIRSWRCIFRS